MNEQLQALDVAGKPTNAIKKMEYHEPPNIRRPAPSVAEMLQAVVEKGITNENVLALEKITELYWKVEEKNAEKAFVRSFVAMQEQMKSVQATIAVPDKQGHIKWKIAAFEQIDSQARPIYQSHGFAVSFAEGDSKPGKITKLCILQHIEGHTRTNPYSLTIGGGAGGDLTNADTIAHSRAKRGALCDALHIVISHLEDDAAEDGAPITADQAQALRRRVIAANIDQAAFLKYAVSESFETIPSGKLSTLNEWLDKKTPPEDKTKALRGKLWEALATVRGAEASWGIATAWLRAKKILPSSVRVSDLTESDLLDAIAKTQIELNP